MMLKLCSISSEINVSFVDKTVAVQDDEYWIVFAQHSNPVTISLNFTLNMLDFLINLAMKKRSIENSLNTKCDTVLSKKNYRFF